MGATKRGRNMGASIEGGDTGEPRSWNLHANIALFLIDPMLLHSTSLPPQVPYN
jgi:hypothetical protein